MNARVQDETVPEAVSEEPSRELDSLLRAAPARTPQPAAPAVFVGHVVSLSDGGAIGVEFPGSGGVLTARLMTPWPAGTATPPIEIGQRVVLTFENADPTLPIILGFITPAQFSGTALQVIEADVDGKRVCILAQDEIVLQCGNASVTLRRNGRVVIRGTYVETCSEGTNRIKGGQVRIN